MNRLFACLALLGFGFSQTALAAAAPALAQASRGQVFVLAAPAARNHAPSLLSIGGGRMLLCWYGGRDEADASVAIYCARTDDDARSWSPARTALAPGAGPVGGPRSKSLGNPVLFRVGSRTYMAHGVIVAEPLCRNWACARTNITWSDDDGATWATPTPLVTARGALPRGHAITRADGARLLPIYLESARRSQVATLTFGGIDVPHVDLGPIGEAGLIQPSIAQRPDGAIFAYFRDRARRAVHVSRLDPASAAFERAQRTALPNPDSAVEAVATSADVALIFNPSRTDRRELALARAKDGVHFGRTCTLVSGAGDVAYPSAATAANGDIVVAFSAADKREIRTLRIPADTCRD